MNRSLKVMLFAVVTAVAVVLAVAGIWHPRRHEIAAEPKPTAPALSTTPAPTPTAPTPATADQTVTFDQLMMPAGLFALHRPSTRSNDHAQVTVGTWRTTSSVAAILTGLEAANPALHLTQSGTIASPRLTSTTGEPGTGAVGTARQIEVDAVASPEAKETLVRIVDTLYLTAATDVPADGNSPTQPNNG